MEDEDHLNERAQGPFPSVHKERPRLLVEEGLRVGGDTSPHEGPSTLSQNDFFGKTAL